MNTETPTPRLVPDRPSAVAIGNAFLSYFRPDGFAMYPSSGSELFREVLERAREIDAAAPPAEAPAVDHGMSCADMEVAFDCSRQVIADQKSRIERLEALLFAEQTKPVAAPAAPVEDWTDSQIAEFMAVALRHTEYKRATHGPTSDEIRQGLRRIGVAPRVTGGREAEFVVELLIEAGHVPRGRVSQARAIAKNAAIQAATGGAVSHEG